MVTFTSVPAGNRNTNGTFNNIGNNGNWWSSTENNTSNAWNRNMNYNNGNVNRNNNNKSYGFTVRCLRDF
ncbi:MAG: FISUMP domain-containing protein [Bacteroidota bacterium]